MPSSVYDTIKWCCFKDLKIELLDGYFKNMQLDDMEISQDINIENNETYTEKLIFGTPVRYTPGLKSIYYKGSNPSQSGITVYRTPDEVIAGTIQNIKLSRLAKNYSVRRLTCKGTVRETGSSLSRPVQPYWWKDTDATTGAIRYFVIGSKRFFPRAGQSEILAKEVVIGS